MSALGFSSMGLCCVTNMFQFQGLNISIESGRTNNLSKKWQKGTIPPTIAVEYTVFVNQKIKKIDEIYLGIYLINLN